MSTDKEIWDNLLTEAETEEIFREFGPDIEGSTTKVDESIDSTTPTSTLHKRKNLDSSPVNVQMIMIMGILSMATLKSHVEDFLKFGAVMKVLFGLKIL